VNNQQQASVPSHPRILIVEDEPSVSAFIEQALSESGMDPFVAPDLAHARALWQQSDPDLVLLDLMLPDGDGLELLRDQREQGRRTPVIVLSAKSGLADRISGLDQGADDYLPKPFSVEELLARIRAQLRRSKDIPPSSVHVGDLEVDLFARRALLKGRNVFLSSTEFRLLELLANHLGQTVTKTQILEYVWDDPERDANVVEVYVNYLRNKLERGGAPRLIHTVRGRGYVLQRDTPSG
jgi:DNA-binding response OmpR family regulator